MLYGAEYIEDEIWVPAAGCVGDRYLVSNLGRVLSNRKNGSVATTKILHQGRRGPYARVPVTTFGKKTRWATHALVLESFGLPRPIGNVCRHLDGNPLNNRLDNLAWGTPKDNSADRIAHGRSCRGESNKWAKLTNDDVREIVSQRREGVRMVEIAARFGVSLSNVYSIVRGNTWADVTGVQREHKRALAA